MDIIGLFTWQHFVPTHENAEAALEFLEKFITLGVLPATLTLFFKERKKERQAAEYLVYDALDQHYGEFLKLMMESPLLPVYPSNARLGQEGLCEQQKIRQLAAFELLISIFERAFLMYGSEELPRKNTQWGGWAECIHSWCRREGWDDFFEQIDGSQFDARFVHYIQQLKAVNPADARALPEPVSKRPDLVGSAFGRIYGTFATLIMNYGMALIPLSLVLLLGIYITAPGKPAEAAPAAACAKTPVIESASQRPATKASH